MSHCQVDNFIWICRIYYLPSYLLQGGFLYPLLPYNPLYPSPYDRGGIPPPPLEGAQRPP